MCQITLNSIYILGGKKAKLKYFSHNIKRANLSVNGEIDTLNQLIWAHLKIKFTVIFIFITGPDCCNWFKVIMSWEDFVNDEIGNDGVHKSK